MTKFININGLVISNIIYGIDDYVVLENTNRQYKIYYDGAYRKDANPYFNYKGKRYHLNEFISDSI